MMFFFVSWILVLLLILLSVAFFTLFERKVMGLIHLRVGPNKVFYLGLLQPLLDAVKLLSKFYSVSATANLVPYYTSPIMSLVIALVLWITVPLAYTSQYVVYSLFLFMCVTSLMVLPLLLSGWASNSKYSFVGCLRSIAQSISYEAVFSTLMVVVMCLFMTYSIKSVSSFKFVGLCFLLPLWVFSALAESHRAPFDFSESESELVSGFNTEYSGGLFAFIFLSEYCTLLVTSYLIVWLFFGGFYYPQLSVLIVLLVSFLFIVIRVTYCRFRYDLLMMAAWKSYLPLALLGASLLFVCV